jgi:outer membrane protein insertion porin family
MTGRCSFFLGLTLATIMLLVAASPSAAGDSAPPLAAIEVILPPDVGDSERERWTEMVKNLSLLTIGERLTTERLADAREALDLSGRFEELELERLPGSQGSTLKIRVKPYRQIRRIQIRGHYPLFENEVRKALPVYVGDRYDPAQLPAIRQDVEALYRRAGYLAPRVTLKTHGDIQGGRLLSVEIHKGPPQQLSRLTISGNKAFGTATLKRKLGVWRDTLKPWRMPFSEARLKKDVEGLLDFYRRKRFADARITYTLDQSADDSQSVGVSLTVDEGPRYTIAFEGNDHFWNLTLKKDLTLRQTGNLGGRGLRKSIRQMQARYRRAGFQDARITPQMEEIKVDAAAAGYPQRHVRLVIEEGPRTQVREVKLAGNRALSDDAIRGQLLTRPSGTFHWGAFDQEVFEEDLFSLSALYLQQGYLKAEITPELTYSPDRAHLDILLRIEEGPQTQVSAVTVSGSQVLDKVSGQGLVGLAPGEPFRRYMLKSDENKLAEAVSEQGYPHVQVQSRLHFSEDNTQVAVAYEIDDGPRVRLGQVYTDGYFKTRPQVIRNTLKTESGAPFSLTEMVNAQRDLRDMEIFEQVQLKTIGLKEQSETVHVVIDAEEKPPYFFQAGGGYETDTGFFGRGRVGDRNLLGRNKSGWLSGEVSEVGYHGELGLTEPRLLGSRINAAAGAFVDRQQAFNQDFGTHSYGTTLTLHYPWSKRLSNSLGMRYESRNQFSRGAVIDPEEADDFEPRTIFVTTPEVRYDSRDNFIRPRSGVLGRFSMDVSKGLTNRLDDFLKYELDLRCFVTPLERLTLAWRGFAGHLDPYGANRGVPDDQLFFLGGTNDVRGFAENLLLRDAGGDAVGGRNALFTSLEVRFDLGGNFELTSFYDLGSLQDEDNRSGDNRPGDPVRSAVGLGLRYHTPIGPIGLLYGHKLGRESGEDAGRLHFSIGYTF